MKAHTLMPVLVFPLFVLIRCQNRGAIAEEPNIVEEPSTNRCCPTGVMYLNLHEGQYFNHLPGVTDFHPKAPSPGHNCSHMVDFNVTFDPPFSCESDRNPHCGKRLLKLRLEIDEYNHGGYMFNIAQGSTNNGYGRDTGTKRNDAKVVGLYNSIFTYYSDYCMDQIEDLIIGLVGARYVTLWIGNEFTRIQTRNSRDIVLQTVSYCNRCLFALNYQNDGNENMDVYVAFNNMVLDTNRQGYGICEALLNWECCNG